MYLSELALHGFKSFAESTDLQFAPGVTAIVGPNGCGKSNIVDAVRWVIGEQRPTALRSEKMENVIFNGTAERRALGMAEVALTVENNRGVLPTEYAEITIGRRLFRDGTSEYLMNGTQCRLKDIRNLFMDTGMGADAYSVIELGMVDEILSDNNEDRRRLFEEAAGITKYKLRRRQSLRKLDSTQADLTRLGDLTGEIAGKVRRLKRQAEKAATFREVEKQLRAGELLLARAEHARLSAQRRRLQQELSKAQRDVETQTAAQSEAEQRITRLRGTLDEQEGALAARREALQERRAEVRRLEADQRLQHERLQTARRDRRRALETEEEAAARRADLEQTQQRLAEDAAASAPALEEAEAALDEAREVRETAAADAEDQRAALRTLRQEQAEADAAHAKRQRARDRLASRIDLLEDEQERIDAQLATLEENAATLGARAEEGATAQREADAALHEARAELHEAEETRAQQQDALDAATEKKRRLERRLDAAEAEVQLLESLVASYDAFSDAVQFLAAAAEEADAPLPGALLTVADVLSCDEADRLALNAALGDLAGCVVVRSRAEARAAVELLRREDKGQATFVVLEALPDLASSDGAPPDSPDGATPLRAAVRPAEPSYAPLADVLLAGCYLAGTLDEAEAAAQKAEGGARVYARTGEWAGAQSFVRGGSRQTTPSPAASRLGRREQLEEARRVLDQMTEAYEAQQEAVRAQQQALEAVPHEVRRTAVRAAEQTLSEAEKEAERARYEHDALVERREEFQRRLHTLADDLAADRAEATALHEKTEEADKQRADLHARRAAAEEAFQDCEAEHRAAQERFGEASVRAVETRNRVENLRRDAERTRQHLQDLDDQAEARARELKLLEETIEATQDRQAELQQEIDALREARDAHEDAALEAQHALATTKAAIAETESTLRGLRQSREERMRQENQRAVRLAEVKTRLTDLTESTREDFTLDLTEQPPPPEDFDEDAARREVIGLRKKKQGLGSVNPLALEEYEEEKERLDFLTEQQADLQQAEDTLLQTISEINETAAARFAETFEAIQRSFTGLFERLFGEGAKARLQLEDESDPLESTIEIVAQPRGKKPSVLSQLSSGEKTLTAIALLFAIYLVKPSPFCILDEVDAPLDDANVARFMNLIRDFVDETQFILVTHNQRTMALADRMYGITMQEQGISKLVGVEFDEAAALVGAA